jgi:hypothetical protein
MTPQDFKALLEALYAIEKAIGDKPGSCAVEVVDRFAPIFRMLLECHTFDDLEKLKAHILEIQKTYVDIAEEVMNEK